MSGKPAARLGDIAACPNDSHGCKGCSHSVQGPAVSGSPDVFINGKPALRVGDVGVHCSCCGGNVWTAAQGSKTVFINGKPAARMGDKTTHCGGTGKIVQGSSNVFIGDGVSIGGFEDSDGPPTCGICGLEQGMEPSDKDTVKYTEKQRKSMGVSESKRGNNVQSDKLNPTETFDLNFDEQIKIVDKNSGEIVTDYPYYMEKNGEKLIFGYTDENGKTPRLSSNNKPEEIIIYWGDEALYKIGV